MDVFVGLLVIFSIFMLYPFLKHWKKETAYSVPNVITTLGILGTFVGITYSLLWFDVTNIQGSVPKLLDGLKLAFITSIIGMALALIFRVLSVKKGEVSGATVDTLASILTKMSENQKSHFIMNSSQLANMEKALIGEGDSTLLTQIQKMRTSFSDKQDELIQEFKTFAEKVTEANMEALTKAIEDLIKDFNVKITEQFGDNFKRLNEAVGKLLEWQDNYKQQVEEMVRQIKIAQEGIEASEKSLEKITKSSETMIEMVEKLDSSLELLMDGLGTFSEMSDKAKEALPIIEKEINRLTQEFSEAVRTAVDESKKIAEFQQASILAQSEQLTKSHKDSMEATSKSFSSMNAQIERLISENLTRVKEQIELIDKSLGEELNKALNSLGSQLHSLSKQFVEDYSPLTDKLREVVEMARGIE